MRPRAFDAILPAWAAMNYAVVPLSRARPPPFIPAWFIDGILAHLLLVGLLLAFVARRSARRVVREQA